MSDPSRDLGVTQRPSKQVLRDCDKAAYALGLTVKEIEHLADSMGRMPALVTLATFGKMLRKCEDHGAQPNRAVFEAAHGVYLAAGRKS